jgi:hypothetical protein
MQAKCPHCSASFEVPKAGLHFCPSCGRQSSVLEGSAPGGYTPELPSGFGGPPPPASGGHGAPLGPRELTPWENRAQTGVWGGFWQTWTGAMFRPQEFWPRVRPDANWFDALSFAWILFVVTQVLSLPFGALGQKFAGQGMEKFQEALERMGPWAQQLVGYLMESSVSSALMKVIFSAISYPIFFFVGAAVLHLFCLMLGASKNGFWATARASGYAAAPTLFNFIPCIGVLASIYMIVQLIFGIQSLQETSFGKAAAIVLLPGILLCCCCGGVAAVAAGMAGVAAGTAN